MRTEGADEGSQALRTSSWYWYGLRLRSVTSLTIFSILNTAIFLRTRFMSCSPRAATRVWAHLDKHLPTTRSAAARRALAATTFCTTTSARTAGK